jgi:hypothetical protein
MTATDPLQRFEVKAALLSPTFSLARETLMAATKRLLGGEPALVAAGHGRI